MSSLQAELVLCRRFLKQRRPKELFCCRLHSIICECNCNVLMQRKETKRMKRNILWKESLFFELKEKAERSDNVYILLKMSLDKSANTNTFFLFQFNRLPISEQWTVSNQPFTRSTDHQSPVPEIAAASPCVPDNVLYCLPWYSVNKYLEHFTQVIVYWLERKEIALLLPGI
jgi:hypothetical protein